MSIPRLATPNPLRRKGSGHLAYLRVGQVRKGGQDITNLRRYGAAAVVLACYGIVLNLYYI